MTETQTDALLSGIWDEAITEITLSQTLFSYLFNELFESAFGSYEAAAKKLSKAQIGYTKQIYRESLGRFSAAKSYQQIKEMSAFVFTDDGSKRPLKEFKEKAGEIFDTYNKTYLKVERDSAFRVGNARASWGEIENTKDVFPYLKYVTVGDARVRKDHAELDGIVRKVDDAFWNRYFPPNDWNCRCRVIQLDQGKETRLGKLPEISPDFQFNPGKVDYVFSDKHPYFDRVPKKLLDDNFGLKIPKV